MNTYPSMKPFRPLGTLFAFLFATILKIEHEKNILLAVCFLMPLATMAQNDTLGHERNITLSEAIVLARTQSVDAAVALNELKPRIGNTVHSVRTCCRK